jgi:DNA helicase-2/ATP-dependent DNA helicase PcrA
MNHRSQQRIVDLINRIWEAELEGRSQPATGIRQHARTERSGGFVRIYVGDASLSPQEKILRETRCAEAMAAASHQDAWLNRSSGYQVLALEHKLAAGRGGFLDVFNAMSLIDPEANRPQGAGDNTGPSAAQVLLRELPALAACVDGPKGFNEFDAIEVLNRYDRLSGLPTDLPSQQARLAELHEAIREFAAACLKADCTVREVLDPVVRHRLFEVDERLAQAFHDPDPPPAIPARPADESTSDRCRRGWHDLFSTRWAEVELYRAYLEGRSKLATHQVVKGSEFEHVMVIMDDHQASGFLFAYDKLFGAVSLSARDHDNVAQQKETTIDRTLRLLYVTCSRARESLALVLWSSNPDAALRSIRAGGWFSEAEIEQIPAE